jgi:hypothetical protein
MTDIDKSYKFDNSISELSFELESYQNNLLNLFGLEESFPREVKVIIKGKRIWWKPWKRRPDKEYYFPKVDVTTNNGIDYTLKISERMD